MCDGNLCADAERTHPEFVSQWRALARVGKCDSWGGMESQRVFQEWVHAGCPAPIATFIQERAV